MNILWKCIKNILIQKSNCSRRYKYTLVEKLLLVFYFRVVNAGKCCKEHHFYISDHLSSQACLPLFDISSSLSSRLGVCFSWSLICNVFRVRWVIACLNTFVPYLIRMLQNNRRFETIQCLVIGGQKVV